MERKKNPAHKAADDIRKIKAEKRLLIAENKAYKWEIAHIRLMLPWLDEIEDAPLEAKVDYVNPDFSQEDPAGKWLTPEEYTKLSTADKNQLALNRYQKRHKTNEEIGREYERYIGYYYE